MKRRVAGILLSLALTVTSVLSGVMSPMATMETRAAEQTPAYRNVMYYGEWSIYAGQKNFYPSKIDGSQITHLNFAFLDMDANGDLVLCDEHADFLTILPEQNGLTYGEPYAGVLGAMSILRSKYPNMKIGISVGGWTRSGDFAAVAADPAKRANFAKNISKFVDYLGYDFVDIDWEYPTAVRASDPAGNGVTVDEGCPGTEADTKNFTLLMQAIRDELDALGDANGKYYELSTAMSASPAMMSKIEYDKVLDIVDFANMMTYDLNGAWNAYTGHQTALYTNTAYDPETQKDGQFSVDACVQYLKDTYGNSIDYSKIVIGVAPYTRGWAGVQNDGPDPDNPGLYATAEPNSVKAPDGTTSGTFAYGDIETLKSQYQLTEYYDEKAQAAYYYSAETGYFFTCDNERSVAAKGQYVKENGLGGLISWMASLDSTNSLTKVMKESLYGDAKLPAQEITVANPKVSVDVTAEGSTYTITIKNNETAVETNTALKDAELFKKTVMYPKLYIKSKSGATFSAGSQSGSVTNQDGYGVIDLSSVYAAKSMKPGTSHTFTVNVSGTADTSDIEGITMTQRILTSLDEFGAQNVWGSDVEELPSVEDSSEEVSSEEESSEDMSSEEESSDEESSEEVSSDEESSEDSSEESGNDKIPTGSYAAWASGTTYQLGDLVSYEGKVYECIYAHTSHMGWLPDATPTLWKERTDLVNDETPSEEESSEESSEEDGKVEDDKENNYYVNSALPQHMVTGYWHNFCNGSTNLKLSDVPEYYDMICVAFTGNTSTPGEVTFALDTDLCNALGGYTKAEFIQDIKDLKAKGQHVIISVGGAEGRIEINSDAAADLFAEGLIDIIEEYGFEGVDIDLEGSAVSGVNYIAGALRTVHDHFGDDFIITMAPETFYIQADRLSANDITTSYLRLALEIKDILTICYPQFYNSGGMNGYGGAIVNPGSADFLTSLSTLIIEAGLRPDQVALGVPATSQAAGSGYVSNTVIEDAVWALVNGTSSGNFTAPEAYPTLRGVMTWSINWDATNDYAWAKAMAELMDEIPEVDNGSTDTPDPSEEESSEDVSSEEESSEVVSSEEESSEDVSSEEESSEEVSSEEESSEEVSSEEESSEDSGDDKTPTGSYDAWAPGTTYQLGDLVSYEGKVYECIYAHTSHMGWLPDATPTLWKERTDLVNDETPSEEESSEESSEEDGKVEDDKENNYYVNSALPQHMVTGYWHNFCNGSTNLKLSDVPEYYDMICVAFTGNTATPGEVTFELDGDLCRALGGYTKAEFIQDIKDLKAKGQHVIISVGGAEGRIEINSDAAADLFAEGLIDIIEEYGFEGVDIDLEGSAVSGVNYIAGALRTVHDHFGDDFIITMAPETFYIQADRLSANDITTSYLRLALEIKDILTICYPQFYNSGGMNGYGGAIVNPGSADFLTSLSTLIIEAGLRPDQVALGVPATSQAAGSGYVSNTVIEDAVWALVNGTSSGNFTAPEAYPTLRGVMTWSINWDATNDYAWAKAMAELMDEIPEVDNGSTDKPEPSKPEEPSEEESSEEPSVEVPSEEESSEEPSVEVPSEEDSSEEPSVEEPSSEESSEEESSEDVNVSDIPTWDASSVYVCGDKVIYNGKIYQASWWTQGTNPEKQVAGGPWKLVGNVSDNDNDEEEESSSDVSGVPAWSASVVYVGGDQVSYNGKIYKAAWWTQGDNPEKGLPWKLVE